MDTISSHLVPSCVLQKMELNATAPTHQTTTEQYIPGFLVTWTETGIVVNVVWVGGCASVVPSLYVSQQLIFEPPPPPPHLALLSCFLLLINLYKYRVAVQYVNCPISSSFHCPLVTMRNERGARLKLRPHVLNSICSLFIPQCFCIPPTPLRMRVPVCLC
jgi:hypothetical protein